MNQGVVDWVRASLLPIVVRGKRALDVGALDVNGSMRWYLESLKPAEIVGIDIEAGPAVDVVLDVKDLLVTFGPKRWDLILCNEMLEHCFHWQEAIYQMKESLVEGGMLLITTRSPGFGRHDFPNDHWRFTKQTLIAALSDLQDVQTWSDPGYTDEGAKRHWLQPGVFIRGWRAGPVGTPAGKAEPAPEYEGVNEEEINSR